MENPDAYGYVKSDGSPATLTFTPLVETVDEITGLKAETRAVFERLVETGELTADAANTSLEALGLTPLTYQKYTVTVPIEGKVKYHVRATSPEAARETARKKIADDLASLAQTRVGKHTHILGLHVDHVQDETEGAVRLAGRQ